MRKSNKLFPIFRQGENDVLIVGMARWEEQLKALVVLERHCLALKEEVEHSSKRQEVLAVLMEGKINMQKTGPEKYLEERKTKEALELVQKKTQAGQVGR